jgi:hypothetical protein
VVTAARKYLDNAAATRDQPDGWLDDDIASPWGSTSRRSGAGAPLHGEQDLFVPLSPASGSPSTSRCGGAPLPRTAQLPERRIGEVHAWLVERRRRWP